MNEQQEEVRIEKVCFLVNNAADVLRAEGWAFTGIFDPPEAGYLTPDGETLADRSEAAEYAHRVWAAGAKAFLLTWPKWRLRAIPGYSPEAEIIIRGRTESEALARLCDFMAWDEGRPAGSIFERVEDDEGEGE